MCGVWGVGVIVYVCVVLSNSIYFTGQHKKKKPPISVDDSCTLLKVNSEVYVYVW